MTTSTDTLTKLHPTDTGVYELTTESGSRYTIDLDAWTLVRETGIPIRPLVESGVLRRDSQTIKLVGIDRVVVGRRALLRIDLGVEGLGCITRDTTVVTSITAKVLAAV